MPFLPPEALADEASIAATSARAVTLARRGDTRAALNLALQARRRARSLESTRGELDALNAAAVVHLIRGDAVAAVAASLDARELARRAGDPSQCCQAALSLQMSAFILEVGDESLGELRACVELGCESKDAALELRARGALGVVLGDRGRFDAAAYEFERALTLAHAFPESGSAARITANVANLHRKRAVTLMHSGFEARAMRECRVSLQVARRACELAAQEEEVPVEIDALAIAGCVSELAGDSARARVLMRESIALGHAARCPSAIVWVLCELGRFALAAGDFEEARVAYGQALELACELRPSRKIGKACLGLAEVSQRCGDPIAEAAWRERAAEESAAFEIARLQTRRQVA
jgi:tetratricopeptide (TPR) repeat protein